MAGRLTYDQEVASSRWFDPRPVRCCVTTLGKLLTSIFLDAGRLRYYTESLNTKTASGKGSPHPIAKCRVPELMPVLGSRPAGDVSHKPGGRLSLLSARPAVTLATVNMAATNFAAW